eukprot:gene2448-1540_t
MRGDELAPDLPSSAPPSIRGPNARVRSRTLTPERRRGGATGTWLPPMRDTEPWAPRFYSAHRAAPTPVDTGSHTSSRNAERHHMLGPVSATSSARWPTRTGTTTAFPALRSAEDQKKIKKTSEKRSLLKRIIIITRVQVVSGPTFQVLLNVSQSKGTMGKIKSNIFIFLVHHTVSPQEIWGCSPRMYLIVCPSLNSSFSAILFYKSSDLFGILSPLPVAKERHYLSVRGTSNTFFRYIPPFAEKEVEMKGKRNERRGTQQHVGSYVTALRIIDCLFVNFLPHEQHSKALYLGFTCAVSYQCTSIFGLPSVGRHHVPLPSGSPPHTLEGLSYMSGDNTILSAPSDRTSYVTIVHSCSVLLVLLYVSACSNSHMRTLASAVFSISAARSAAVWTRVGDATRHLLTTRYLLQYVVIDEQQENMGNKYNAFHFRLMIHLVVCVAEIKWAIGSPPHFKPNIQIPTASIYFTRVYSQGSTLTGSVVEYHYMRPAHGVREIDSDGLSSFFCQRIIRHQLPLSQRSTIDQRAERQSSQPNPHPRTTAQGGCRHLASPDEGY